MSFYIGCYWKSKGLSLEESALKITGFLKLLKNPESEDLDSFQKWYEVASSKKAALARPVIVEDNSILNLITKKNKQSKNYSPQDFFSEVGFIISFWNGAVNPEDEISIGFIIGASSPYITNSVVLRLPKKLITSDVCKPIFEKMISFWNPQSAVLTSHKIANVINTANEVGILNFFDASYVLPDSCPEKITIERIQNGIIISFVDSLWDRIIALDPALLEDLKKLHEYINPKKTPLKT